MLFNDHTNETKLSYTRMTITQIIKTKLKVKLLRVKGPQQEL